MKYNLVNKNFKENYSRELLKARGVTDFESFFNPSEKLLQSPFDLDNISEGIQFIQDTINTELPYALVVDCDVDGYTSATIIYQYLKCLNPEKEIVYYIHSAKQHGLEDVWKDIAVEEYAGVLLPDAGSNDSCYAEQINCPILVLDHHILEEKKELAPNMILINNQESKAYKNKNLSGAGVTWQFCRALDETLGKDYAENFIDLAALGVIADMMSVIELENRYIITKGLANIKNFFFQTLIDKQSFPMKGKINPMTVSFYISPLINAMIRVGSQEEKERLFLAFIDGKQEVVSGKRGAKGALEKVAIESARECVNARNRQNTTKEKAVKDLEMKILKNGLDQNQILFIRLEDEDDFPPEMNGLVAMQLASKFNKPTIVARLNDEGYIRGSARGLNQSELVSFKDFLDSTSLFEYTVGHDNAFGISIPNHSLSKLHDIANKELAHIDFNEDFYGVNFVRSASATDLVELILDLGEQEDIWGQHNTEPLIYISELNITDADIEVVGQRQDTVRIHKNGVTYMKFWARDFIEELKEFPEIQMNIIGKPNLNYWNGMVTPQIFISSYEILDGRLSF